MPLPVNKAASGLTFFLGFTAFLLSILTLFAGSTKSFLVAGDMLSVNISQIGRTPLFGSGDTSKCPRDVIDKRFGIGDIGNAVTSGVNTVTQQGGNIVQCGVGQIENGLNQAQNAIVDKLDQAANLPGFIDLHVMNFCSGQFDPKDYVAKGIKDPKKDVDTCSPKLTSFSFSLTDIVQNALPSGLTLQDIQWPSSITDAENALKIATRFMIYMYIVGVSTAAATALISIAGFFVAKGVIGLVIMGVSGISFFTLMLASAASTAIIQKAVPEINKVGNPIGIAATQGNVFLGMTWAATILMFIAIIAGVGQFFARKRMGGGSYDNYDDGGEEYYEEDKYGPP